MRCPPSAGAMAGPKEWLKFDRPKARPRLSGGEGAVQNTHAERRDGATPDALDGAEKDQRVHVPGQPTERRADDEDERGEDEQLLRPQPCPQPSDGGDEDRLDDLEGGLHPLDAVEVGAQAAHHAGDGDVQHPAVERHGQAAEHHTEGRPPVGCSSLLLHGNGFLRVQLSGFTADTTESVEPVDRQALSLSRTAWRILLSRLPGMNRPWPDGLYPSWARRRGGFF